MKTAFHVPIDLMRGRGQVPLRHAVRIVLGRNLTSRRAFVESLLWGIGAGVFNNLLNPHVGVGFMLGSSLFIAFCIGYLSPIAWRWKVLPGRPRPVAVLMANGLVAFAVGFVCFYLSFMLAGLAFLGLSTVFMARFHAIAALISTAGFIFAFVGFYQVMGHDAERRERRTQREGERMTRLAEEARLVALRSQINPHFFFNALNTIAALIPRNPSDAERAVELLATALRPVLTREQPLVSTLESEIAVARAYGEIEQLRMGDRLRIEWRIDPAALARRIPSLSLQPLVENAVRHGAACTTRSTLITVDARIEEGDDLRISVRNICGEPGNDLVAAPLKPGHALHNIAARMCALFGPGAGLDVQAAMDGSHARADLTIPAPDDSISVNGPPAPGNHRGEGAWQ